MPGLGLNVIRTDNPIVVDGVMDEEVWQEAHVGKNFYQNFPNDTVRATNDTEIRMAYDDNNLYVTIKCMSSGPDLITPSLRRDFDFLGQ